MVEAICFFVFTFWECHAVNNITAVRDLGPGYEITYTIDGRIWRKVYAMKEWDK